MGELDYWGIAEGEITEGGEGKETREGNIGVVAHVKCIDCEGLFHCAICVRDSEF